MGCDIHVVIEQQVGNKWIGLCATDCMQKRPVFAERDYEFFGAVASIRGRSGKFPNGLPYDISELSWLLFSNAPMDHHSASHMPLDDFCNIHHAIRSGASREKHCVYDLTGLSVEDQVFRVVFWFDN